MLPVSTNVRLLFHPVIPETHTPTTEPRSCDVCSGLIWRNGDGGSAFAVRGHRHLEEGCEGLCPDPGARPDAHAGDGDDLGRDEQPDPGATRSSARRASDVCGSRGNQRLLEAVLLSARRRARRDAGQRPRGKEHARTQERCLRCRVAGRSGCAWAGAGLAGAAAADSSAAGPYPGPQRDHPRTQPGGAAAGEAPRRRRSQADVGGVQYHRGVESGNAGGVDRGRTGSGGARGACAPADASEDPRVNRGVDRAVR
jgi:hypothetical protein